MDVIKFSVTDGILKCGFIDGKTKMPHNYNEKISRQILNDVSRCTINAMHFTGNHIRFEVQGKRIEITNGLDLINDKSSGYYEDFRFVRKYISDKNYALQKKKQKVRGISLTIILVAAGITSIVASKANANSPSSNTVSTEVSTMYEAPTEATTIDHPIYIDSNKAELTTEVQETTTGDETTKEEKEDTIESDYVSMLGVGSKVDSDKYKYVRENFYDDIVKYADMYDVNKDVICAILTQESGGKVSGMAQGGGVGPMQIQASVWNGHTLTVFNPQLGEYEKINITTDKLMNRDFNIKVGTGIFGQCLEIFKGNYPLAILAYNKGPGAVDRIINAYCSSTGKTYDDVVNDPTDMEWMTFISAVGDDGDDFYMPNVLQYVPLEVFYDIRGESYHK